MRLPNRRKIQLLFVFWLGLGLAVSSTLAKTVQPNAQTAQKKSAPLPSEYYAAVGTFNSGKYKDALNQFQQLDEHGFCCDKVHYYMAQAYQGMNQTVPASMHYQWVSDYSYDPTLKSYADTALDRLSYYQGHRTYAGNGNNFARVSAAPASSGGSGFG